MPVGSAIGTQFGESFCSADDGDEIPYSWAMYQTHLRHDLTWLGHPDTDPRHVEAAMRSTHGTLDHLGGAEWDEIVRDALAEVRAIGAEVSEAVAQSWGGSGSRVNGKSGVGSGPTPPKRMGS